MTRAEKTSSSGMIHTHIYLAICSEISLVPPMEYQLKFSTGFFTENSNSEEMSHLPVLKNFVVYAASLKNISSNYSIYLQIIILKWLRVFHCSPLLSLLIAAYYPDSPTSPSKEGISSLC